MSVQSINSNTPPLPRPLSVSRSDIESRIGVARGEGTAVNTWLAGGIGLVLTVAFYAAVYFLPDSLFRAMMLDRGPTQYAVVFLGFWCVVILLVKQSKLKIQKRALSYPVVPDSYHFSLSPTTADQVIRNIHAISEDPERFIIFNRILIALSSLKNIGRIGDIDTILRSLADRDESAHQTSFGTLNGFIWAIPVLGFLGTVLGLATAISGFSEMLDQQEDISSIVGTLKGVTAGLSTAFETTLVALVVALVIQLWATSQKTAEETFLDKSQEYCLKQIVSRLRLIGHQPTATAEED